MTGRYKKEANINIRASLSAHVVNNLKEYQKNAAPKSVANTIDVQPVQPSNHGIKLKGINNKE